MQNTSWRHDVTFMVIEQVHENNNHLCEDKVIEIIDNKTDKHNLDLMICKSWFGFVRVPNVTKHSYNDSKWTMLIMLIQMKHMSIGHIILSNYRPQHVVDLPDLSWSCKPEVFTSKSSLARINLKRKMLCFESWQKLINNLHVNASNYKKYRLNIY